MITLYGGAKGRASRSMLALEELGLAYRHVPLEPWAKAEDREVLVGLNPNARVPVLEDDGLIIWESMAINLYLADCYGNAPFWPSDPRERARVYQWSIWAQTEVDVAARHKARFGKAPEARARAEAERLGELTILDRALSERTFLLGDSFTIADLNVASTLTEPWENGLVDGQLDPADHGLNALGDWLRRCTSRPSWRCVGAMN